MPQGSEVRQCLLDTSFQRHLCYNCCNIRVFQLILPHQKKGGKRSMDISQFKRNSLQMRLNLSEPQGTQSVCISMVRFYPLSFHGIHQ